MGPAHAKRAHPLEARVTTPGVLFVDDEPENVKLAAEILSLS